jgi:hypothetical protein
MLLTYVAPPLIVGLPLIGIPSLATLAPPLTHGGAFSCEVAGTEIHKNFLGNGTLPC